MEESGLMEDCKAPLAYQQNDFIAWIERAKRREMKDRRLRQMLEELEMGGVYMNMEPPPSAMG